MKKCMERRQKEIMQRVATSEQYVVEFILNGVRRTELIRGGSKSNSLSTIRRRIRKQFGNGPLEILSSTYQ